MQVKFHADRRDSLRVITYKSQCQCEVIYILKNILGFSASFITKLKHNNSILLNDNVVSVRGKCDFNDTLKIIVPHVDDGSVLSAEGDIDIIYEDDDIICFNKASGTPTHPSNGHHYDTLANYALNYLRKKDDEFHAVTRLDRYTSGIVLVAKNLYSASIMCTKEFSQLIDKIYYGVCKGYFESDTGVVEAPIGRCEDSIIKRCIKDDGKYAKTEFKVLDKLPSGNSLVEFKLYTGRTHQIRVHMKHISHPLKDDFLYDDNCDEDKAFRLHCGKICFKHPYTKEIIEIKCDIPEYFYEK